uniref:Late endosomal/lysosomal adaptor and MAPK and MTOR activator 5 n=1 Tax=Mesocestoides corti TaxID=53468 RepID=A0A5K3FJG9_MESCO
QTCWTTWPQPIPCLSAIEWHAGKKGSQPEKDTTEEQYIMSGVASAVDSDGRARVFYSGVGSRMRSNNSNRTPALSLLYSTQAETLKCQLNLSWRSSDVPYTGSIDIARD